MQQNIHPTYHHDTVVTCACGNKLITGSILKAIHVEICSACHPFFTGAKKLVDTEGRVDRFRRKQQEAAKTKKKKSSPQQSP